MLWSLAWCANSNGGATSCEPEPLILVAKKGAEIAPHPLSVVTADKHVDGERETAP